MAKPRSNTTKRTAYKRSPASSSRPSLRAWIIAIVLVLVFVSGIGFLDSHHKNNPTAFIHQILQHQHSSAETAKAPSFEFYTALPSGKLTMMSSTPSVPTDKKVDSSASIQPTTQNTATAANKTINIAATNTNYFLQVASFAQYTDADRLKAQLLLDDFNVNIEKSTLNGKKWYRVLVGPYGDLNTLSTAQAKLKTLHFSSIKLQLQ